MSALISSMNNHLEQSVNEIHMGNYKATDCLEKSRAQFKWPSSSSVFFDQISKGVLFACL